MNSNTAQQFDFSFESPTIKHPLFSDVQVQQIKSLTIPTILKFRIADKFETKFIDTSSDIWDFYYSGKQETLDFFKYNLLDEIEVKVIKYFLVYYSQLNTPSQLSKYFNHIRSIIVELKTEKKPFDFKSFETLLLNLAKTESVTDDRTYYTVKRLVVLLMSEDFKGFGEENERKLSVLPRPSNFNSRLFYEESEDTITKPLITMIQNGFAKINAQLAKAEPIDDDTLKNSSILGLVYTTGMRPVQLSKLAVADIKIDTYSNKGEPMRYSIVVPYTKQGRYNHARASIKLPEEIAVIIFAYIKQLGLTADEKLFELGKNTVQYCNNAINKQLFDFSPKEYQEQVKNGELIEVKYTSYQFRHHIAYSMAMNGASAEDIAYILGHSSMVTARHYIYSSPNLAQVRAMALGRNPLYQQMISMLSTGNIVTKEQNLGENVIGVVDMTIHSDIGQCAYKDGCFLAPVRSCYGCAYFHPYLDGKHEQVLESVNNEIQALIKISDAMYQSHNPLIGIHESTVFEIKSVIHRCQLIKG